MHGYGDPLVMIVHTADEFRKVSLGLAQGKRCHSQKYDQILGGRQFVLAHRAKPTAAQDLPG